MRSKRDWRTAYSVQVVQAQVKSGLIGPCDSRAIRHLESLGLAERDRTLSWRMKQDWQEQLKRRARRGDIIRTLAAEFGEREPDIRFVQDRAKDAAPIRGIVKAYGPEDELRDTRYLLVEDFDGGIWHVPVCNGRCSRPTAARRCGGALPKHRAMVRVPRTRLLAKVAEQTGGIWSEDLHARHDPGSKPAYHLSLKRRLEALRRAGIGERLATGEWHVGRRVSGARSGI